MTPDTVSLIPLHLLEHFPPSYGLKQIGVWDRTADSFPPSDHHASLFLQRRLYCIANFPWSRGRIHLCEQNWVR